MKEASVCPYCGSLGKPGKKNEFYCGTQTGGDPYISDTCEANASLMPDPTTKLRSLEDAIHQFLREAGRSA